MMANDPSSGMTGGDAMAAAAFSAAGADESNSAIVSILLGDLFESDPESLATTCRILATLLRNALTAENNPKHATVRLSNAKIQKYVVNVPGALDILGAAGFVEAPGVGERRLNYSAPASATGHQERRALVDAICAGLEIKIGELGAVDAAASRVLVSGGASRANEPKAGDASNATASKPSAGNNAGNNNANDKQGGESFLSEKERLERVKKIKAMKKADKAHRIAERQRWMEDAEERKLAAKRREAALSNVANAAAVDNASAGVGVGVGVAALGAKKSNLLPKPFEDATSGAGKGGNAVGEGNDPQEVRRKLIQQYMKAQGLTAQEKQAKIQGLMKMSPGELLEAANALVGPGSSATNDHKMADSDSKMEANDNNLDRKPPPAVAAAAKPPHPQPNSINDDLQVARAPAPPSAEWTNFIESTHRCAGAEGIRESSAFYHKGASSAAAADMAVPKCLKRLFKELDGLKEDLPSDGNCSIWLRFDEETPQYIRALITAPLPGPTPYSGGVFAFDIYVPNDYPQSNPRVKLLTTGGGRVRFGPNLYADGKVCLSLLGTWEGPRWNPKHSSLYQVLISIQGLILGVEHPYYLEPGHGGWEGKVKDGDFQKTGQTLAGQSVKQEVGVPNEVVLYEDVLRVGTAKHAVIEPLKLALGRSALMGSDGMEAFRDIIQAHFCENRGAILAEVRNWTSDAALGRNRSAALERNDRNKGTLQIDILQKLLPKLEELLNRASIPQPSSSIMEGTTEAAGDDASMEVEEDAKPPAKPTGDSKPPAKPSCSSAKGKKKVPGPGAAKKSVAEDSEADPLELKRQRMQEAASNGDFILAGKLQGEVKRLEELQQSMQEAAAQNDFIRAGRLQAQFKALTATDSAPVAAPSASGGQQTTWNDEDSDESSDIDDGSEGISGGDDMDWDSDDGMGGGGPPFPQPHGMGGGGHFAGHGLGSNVYAPPGHKSHYDARKNHSWGAGHTLAAPPAAAAASESAAAAAMDDDKKPAAQKSIPLERLCRLRIRLPNDKSVVEDFDRNDPLSAVYRRLESLVPNQDANQGAVAGPTVPGGAFSQPLSSAGFTLLLTRPKKEFSLEMHGATSLTDLNLAPSATLTVMKCSDRGIMHRGEVESRLRAAQGDAMDVEGLTYEGLMELTERVGKAGPKEGDDFLSLTAEEFEANTEKISPSAFLADLDSSAEKGGEEDRRCPICLGAYDCSDSTPSLRKVKNCGHTMHLGCLQTWLRTNSSCPLCKVHITGKAE